jgi:hypothetical protein
MGNDTDTMTRSLKSVLQLAFALLVMAGLSAGPAMGQKTFLDASLTGSGGDGTEASPYQSGQFQDALSDATTEDDSLIVVNGGVLNAPQGTSTYEVDLSQGTASDSLKIAAMPGESHELEVDLPVNVVSSVSGQKVELAGVDLDLGGNALDFGSGADIVVNSDAGGSGSPGSIVFSGVGSEIQATNASGGTFTIDRLALTSGAETTLQTPVQSTITVTDSVDIAGTLDLGSTNTLLLDADEGSASEPTINISGTVQNGDEVRLEAGTSTDGTFTVGGNGNLSNVDFNVASVEEDVTNITLTGEGSYTVSANDDNAADQIVRFSALTTANDFTVSGSAPVEAETLEEVQDTLTVDNPNASFTSSGALTVEGPANFTQTSSSSALFTGNTKFEDDVTVAAGGDAVVSFRSLALFEEDVIFAGGGNSNLNFEAPGLQDFGALNDYDLDNYDTEPFPDGFDVSASTVEGEFRQNPQSGTGTSTILLEDSSGVDQGIHNLRFEDDISIGDPNNLDVTTEGDARVVFAGTSQEIGLDGDGVLSIENIDVLSNDAVNGEVEIQRDGNEGRTLAIKDKDTEGDGRLRLLGGLFSTEGALDARNATLVRRITEGAEGTISGGGNSDFAYTAGGAISNGGGGTDLPAQIVYMGGEEPERTAEDGMTGPELPDLRSGNDDAQSITTLVSRSPATITINANNNRGSSEYTVDRLAARAGTFELATDVAITNGGTVERLNGTIAEGNGSLNYPTINAVGSDGINLEYAATPETEANQFGDALFAENAPPEGSVFPYENEEDTTGAEFPANSDAILDVTVDSTGTGLPTQNRGAASVLLAETEDFYRFNRNAEVQRGAALGFNGQTLEMNTVEGDDNDFEVVNDGTVASADGSTLRFAGRGLANVIGDVDGSDNSPREFTFPAIAVNKPDDDSDDDSEARRVLFEMDNSSTSEADGFEFEGDFTVADAQNWSSSDDDGVEFESEVIGVNGSQVPTDDVVDVVRVNGNFDQQGGSVLAFDNHAGATFEVTGDFTKDAAKSSRFYAGGRITAPGSVNAFTVGGNLEQANGTFYAIVNSSFDVGGDVVNNSPDKWPASETSGFESEAFEVDGDPGAAATISGSVTQDTTGNPVFDDESTDPIENEGIFLVEGFNGSDGEVSVGANFNQLQGTTEIPDATTASVTDTVSVEGGFFRANLGSEDNNQEEQRFLTANLAVTDSLFEASTDSQVQNPVPQNTEPTNPEPGLNDQIRVSNATDVQPGGRFALEGFELRQGGDFTLLGSGDAPEASVNDPRDAGLRGLVRLVNDGNTRQTVTTDESPSTYFHGLAVNASGDVELGSNVTLNRAAGGQGSANDSVATGTVRPFGTLFLEDGDLYTTGDTLTVLEPEPTDGGDLIEAVSADERRDGNVAEASPVLGGSNATNVVGTMRRALSEQNADTGGQVSDGYIFPLGGTERPEYRALVLEQPTDEQEPEFFTVTSGENPNEPLPDGLTSVDAFDENGTIDLDVQSLPYFRVESDENPDFSAFNMRVISALKPGTVSEVRQLRLIQRDGDWQEAGIYDRDAGSNIDDDAGQTGGPNADISGFRNVIHEGVNIEDGNIIAVASDRSINPLAQDQAIALSGTVAYPTVDNGSLTSGRELEGVEVEASSSDTTATTTTDSNGSFALAGLPAGDYTVAITDVGAEVDNVSTGDALRAVRGFAGIDAFAGSFQEQVADVNDSGNVNATDALLIAQFVLGNVDGFDSGAFVTESESVTVEGGSETSVGLFAAEAGDVRLNGGETGSSQSALASSTVSPKTSGGAVAVQSSGATSSAGAESGETFEVPVRIDRSTTVGAYQMTFDFPSEKASFEGIKGAGQDVLTSASDGTVKVSWFDQSGKSALDLREGSELVTLRFKAADNAEGVEFAPEVTSGEIAAADATPVSAGVEVQAVNISTPTPDQFALNGSYPNPVQGQATIDMDLPSRADVTVEVYNVLGQRVQTMERTMSAGAGQTIKLDGSKLASGQYFYRVKANSEDKTVQESGRITVVK